MTPQDQSIVLQGKKGDISLLFEKDRFSEKDSLTIVYQGSEITIPKTAVAKRAQLHFGKKKFLNLKPINEWVEISDENAEKFISQHGLMDYISQVVSEGRWTFVGLGVLFLSMSSIALYYTKDSKTLFLPIVLLLLGCAEGTLFFLTFSHKIKLLFFSRFLHQILIFAFLVNMGIQSPQWFVIVMLLFYLFGFIWDIQFHWRRFQFIQFLLKKNTE